MKKNLFALIGSALGALSIFFIGAPFVVYDASKNYYIDSSLIGIFGSSYSFNINGALVVASYCAAIACLVIVISGIVQNKKTSTALLALSSVNIITSYSVIKYLNKLMVGADGYTTKYTLGWGIAVTLILLLAQLVLIFVQFVVDMTLAYKANNQSEKEKAEAK